jgi:hypothetical protein
VADAVSDHRDVAVLIAMYHELGGRIAQHEIGIAGLRHEQAVLIGLMHKTGLAYRALAPMLGVSKSRVHQLDTDAETVTLIPPRYWTQAEIDKIKADAKAMHERLMRNIE